LSPTWGNRVDRPISLLGIEAPGEEKKRDRVLIDAEIEALWAACR